MSRWTILMEAPITKAFTVLGLEVRSVREATQPVPHLFSKHTTHKEVLNGFVILVAKWAGILVR